MVQRHTEDNVELEKQRINGKEIIVYFGKIRRIYKRKYIYNLEIYCNPSKIKYFTIRAMN